MKRWLTCLAVAVLATAAGNLARGGVFHFGHHSHGHHGHGGYLGHYGLYGGSYGHHHHGLLYSYPSHHHHDTYYYGSTYPSYGYYYPHHHHHYHDTYYYGYSSNGYYYPGHHHHDMYYHSYPSYTYPIYSSPRYSYWYRPCSTSTPALPAPLSAPSFPPAAEPAPPAVLPAAPPAPARPGIETKLRPRPAETFVLTGLQIFPAGAPQSAAPQSGAATTREPDEAAPHTQRSPNVIQWNPRHDSPNVRPLTWDEEIPWVAE